MRVGVVVPIHGWAPYLAETLDGILSQDPAPDDVVVVDDGSPEPIALHVEHAARCRLVTLPERGGLPAARTAGVAALRDVPLIALCDADDVWRPGKLRAQLTALRRRPSAAAVLARAEIIGPDGRPTGEKWPLPPARLPQLFERNPYAVSGALLRADTVQRAGGIARGTPAVADWDLWLRLLGAGETLTVAPGAVVAYRRHPGAMSGDIAALAREQLALHETHAALVDPATRRRVEAADRRALAAGLIRERRWSAAREELDRAAALEDASARLRRALLSVPLARAAMGRRDPF